MKTIVSINGSHYHVQESIDDALRSVEDSLDTGSSLTLTYFPGTNDRYVSGFYVFPYEQIRNSTFAIFEIKE